ncbi:MAG: GNAT family N-acetyltransferase [Anaerolineae bacterium]|nr:GNAT family N-acetyltransferase [Anaerolineae bacterium]
MISSLKNFLTIRPAQAEDAALILGAYRPVWPEEVVDQAQIQAALQDPSHATVIALWGGKAVGFADGFLTVSPDGVRRWEFDLLGIIPEWRGQGIAGQLIQTNLAQATAFHPQFARALIRLENIASQRVFASAGFLEQPAVYYLYVARLPVKSHFAAPLGATLVPVQTFAYNGFWLEGYLTEEALWAARAALTETGDLAGVLIHAKRASDRRAAVASGYDLVGAYRWWHYCW